MFDCVVVLGRDMQVVVGRKLGDQADRMKIIPNWGDVDEIAPLAPGDNAFAIEHGLSDQTVIQFSGNLGRTHDVELFLDAARSVSDDPGVTFLVVGFGGKAPLVDEAANEEGLANLLVLPRQPRERLAMMLNASTATVISFVDGMYGISVPSRMYNIMAAARPIIAVAHPQSELALVVAEEQAGWVIGDDDRRDELQRLVRYLGTAEGKAEAAKRGANARHAVERRFTLPIVAEQFRTLLSDQPQNHSVDFA